MDPSDQNALIYYHGDNSNHIVCWLTCKLSNSRKSPLTRTVSNPKTRSSRVTHNLGLILTLSAHQTQRTLVTVASRGVLLLRVLFLLRREHPLGSIISSEKSAKRRGCHVTAVAMVTVWDASFRTRGVLTPDGAERGRSLG